MVGFESVQSTRKVQDIINLILAALLFVSPWGLRYSNETPASQAAWIGGVVIAVVAIAAIVQFAEWEEWLTMLLGAAVIVAPWVVGYSNVANAVAADVILGALILLVSAWEVWAVHHPVPPAQRTM